MQKIGDYSGKILVTGAGGLNGTAIMREFEQRKVPVTGVVRNLAKLPPGSTSVINYVEADLLKPETYAKALEGVERALLMSTGNPQMAETQCTFIDACKAAGVKHVIKFSGEESGIGFNPQKFIFTRMHEEIEDYLENSGLLWTHIRPSQFMEVYLREAPAIINTGVLALPLADIRLSPVAVRDIVAIVFALLTQAGHAGKSLRITGPEALSMADIATIISRVTGRPVHYEAITPEERRQRLLGAGVPAFFADAVTDQAIERRRHPQSRIDISTHQLFGVTPTRFEDFAQFNAKAFGKDN